MRGFRVFVEVPSGYSSLTLVGIDFLAIMTLWVVRVHVISILNSATLGLNPCFATREIRPSTSKKLSQDRHEEP